MYYLIYKTVNTISNKYYIGKHTTLNIDDGYLGSGTILSKAIKKYGKSAFTCKILHYCESEEAMNRVESELITKAVVDDKMSYNIVLGGNGGKIVLYPDHPLYDEVRKLISNGRSGQRAWTNGVEDRRSAHSPGDGWRIGRSAIVGVSASITTKNKMKSARSNGACKWWNNGMINKRSAMCPGVDWTSGRLFKEKSTSFLTDKEYMRKYHSCVLVNTTTGTRQRLNCITGEANQVFKELKLHNMLRLKQCKGYVLEDITYNPNYAGNK